MKKFIIGLIGVIFASVMAVSISSCGEDPIEEIDKEQVDDEKEEKEEETSQIVGVWKKGSGKTIKFKVDGTGYTEHNGDFEWFAYTFNSKTNVVTITDGTAFEDDIDQFKIRFIEENIIQLGWWIDGEWSWESDEIYYRQNDSDNEEEEEGESTPLIVGAWKKGSGRTIKFKDDGTGYTEHNGDFEWFAYTFNSKTNVVTITDGTAFEDDIDQFKIRFIEENIIQLGWWIDGEWSWESDEIYYRQNDSDNEEEEEGESTPLIVGTWKYFFDGGYCLLKINEDMTAIYNEWDDGEWDAKDEKYNYVYDETNNIIYFYDFYTGELWEACQIASITKTEMRTLDFLDGGICIWKRQ